MNTTKAVPTWLQNLVDRCLLTPEIANCTLLPHSKVFKQLYDDDEGIYDFPFFGSGMHAEFIRQTAESDTDLTFLTTQMRVIIPTEYTSSTSTNENTNNSNMQDLLTPSEKVVSSMAYRVPVYYGSPASDMYNNILLQKTLGYSDADAIERSQDNSDVRYGYVGPVRVSHPPFLVTQQPCSPARVFYCHTWGVNFESCKTADYQRHFRGGVFLEDEYRKSVQTLVRIMIGAAEYVYDTHVATLPNDSDGWLRVRIPAIGLGAFLSAVSKDVSGTCCDIFFHELISKIMNVNRFKRIHWHLCIFDENLYPCVNQQLTLFGVLPVGTPPIHMTLEKDIYTVQETGPYDRYLLINAWDSLSLVGNGGFRDPTLDGFTVAATGPGKQLPSTAVFIQPLFAKNMWNRENWVSVD